MSLRKPLLNNENREPSYQALSDVVIDVKAEPTASKSSISLFTMFKIAFVGNVLNDKNRAFGMLVEALDPEANQPTPPPASAKR